MVILGLEQLIFRLANALGERYPSDQFLPEELNDTILAVINSIGASALDVAVNQTYQQLDEGVSPEEWASLRELETIDRFATDYMSRESIVSLIEDMSGLDREPAEFALGVVEGAVDEPVFGLGGTEVDDVNFEGLGVIKAGTDRSYHIDLAESLYVPPLKNISVLSQYTRAVSEAG